MAKNKKRPFLPWAIIFSLLLIVIISAVIYSFIAQQVKIIKPTQQKPLPRLNEYNAEAFYYEDGFLRYKDRSHMIGIDISVHQGIIRWQEVADAGIDFALIRAGYRGSTLGSLYEDEQFRYNLQEAKKVGIKVGLYFFSQALTTKEAVEEAIYVCELLDGEALDLPIYFDWEYLTGRVDAPTDISLTDRAIAFCEEIQLQGYDAGVYFNQSFGYTQLDLKKLENYHLWLAEYNEIPTFRYHFDCLQYTEDGKVNGIDTKVDLNILFPIEKETE